MNVGIADIYCILVDKDDQVCTTIQLVETSKAPCVFIAGGVWAEMVVYILLARRYGWVQAWYRLLKASTMRKGHHVLDGCDPTVEIPRVFALTSTEPMAHHVISNEPVDITSTHTTVRQIEDVSGNIHQFSFPRYKPSTWACGSIALYACMYSEWTDPQQWGPADLDSIVINGLRRARVYPNAHEGQVDMVQQIRRICPEMNYRVSDVTTWNNAYDWVQHSGKTERFFVTMVVKGTPVGHHTFMIHHKGYWYWFEPMRINLQSTGGTLKIFHSAQELDRFIRALMTRMDMNASLVRVRHSRFSQVLRQQISEPRPIVRARAYELDTATGPVDVALDEFCEWSSGSNKGVLRVELRPNTTVRTNMTLPCGSRVYVSRETSMFVDPCIWVTLRGYKALIGNRGANLSPFIRHSRQHNCEWSGSCILVVREIVAGEELLLPSRSNV